MSDRGLVPLALALLLLLPTGLEGQTPEIESSRRRLDSIKVARQRLQQEQERLATQVKDVNAELSNIEAQRQTTYRIINEIDNQIAGLNSQVDRVSAELLLAEDNLSERRAVLERRLVDIYKRGTLYSWQVLLAAESFGDLLSRYKYLFLTSRQDRALVSEVENLRDRVRGRRDELLGLRGNLDRTRVDRDTELNRYTDLANARERRLRELRRSGVQTEERLTQLEQDEAAITAELNRLIAESRRGGARRAGSITTADLGQLDWPVNGEVLYNFGRERAGGVTIRRNGIGIGAPVGTPVRVIAGGTVVRMQRWSTYGLMVLIDHGGEYISLYTQLEEATVSVGAEVTKGQIIGRVGGANTEYGPHLHFEIRNATGTALDPTDWLRNR